MPWQLQCSPEQSHRLPWLHGHPQIEPIAFPLVGGDGMRPYGDGKFPSFLPLSPRSSLVVSSFRKRNNPLTPTSSPQADAEAAIADGVAMASRLNGVSSTVTKEAKAVVTSFNKVAAAIAKARKAMESAFAPIATPFTTLGSELSQVGKDFASIQNRIADLTSSLSSLKGLEVYLDAVIAEYTALKSKAERGLSALTRLARYIGSSSRFWNAFTKYGCSSPDR